MLTFEERLDPSQKFFATIWQAMKTNNLQEGLFITELFQKLAKYSPNGSCLENSKRGILSYFTSIFNEQQVKLLN
jgi:hypothetical protein